MADKIKKIVKELYPFDCKDGTLLIKKIYNEKNIDISKFIKQGDRFYTPQKILEKALIYRQKP